MILLDQYLTKWLHFKSLIKKSINIGFWTDWLMFYTLKTLIQSISYIVGKMTTLYFKEPAVNLSSFSWNLTDQLPGLLSTVLKIRTNRVHFTAFPLQLLVWSQHSPSLVLLNPVCSVYLLPYLRLLLESDNWNPWQRERTDSHTLSSDLSQICCVTFIHTILIVIKIPMSHL